jgi:hypothetical protein
MSGTVADIETYAAVKILDHVQAYYKVVHDYIYHLSFADVGVIGSNKDLYRQCNYPGHRINDC